MLGLCKDLADVLIASRGAGITAYSTKRTSAAAWPAYVRV
jgi:hypothetical protein